MSSKNRQPMGVVLLNLGGPDSLEAVEPFLVNLFSDPDILPFPMGGGLRSFFARLLARRRAGKVREYYRLIGGGSPIVRLTQAQAHGLEKELNQRGEFRVFVAMRYWHPLIDEALEEIVQSDLQQLVLLPLYPQYSMATTGSSFREFERLSSRWDFGNREVIRVHHWFDHPAYIHSLVLNIREAIREVQLLEGEPLHLVFSAHGVPLRLIRRGDPYQHQVEETVRLVHRKLGVSNPMHLSYQSRVGPLQWTGPSTDELLKRLAGQRVKQVLIIPISFVSDHSETLYEIDILYKGLANELGITGFYRMPSLNDSPAFLKALSDIVVGACESGERL